MARTIDEIKAQIGAEFISHPAIRQSYDITGSDKTFSDLFSPVSLESVMFYVVASCIWLLEKLFDRHQSDIDLSIESKRPHTLRWYVAKTLEYMRGHELIMTDGVIVADHYDTEGMTAAEIDAARVVKYAVATEDSSRVYVKIAGADEDGRPVPLGSDDYDGVCHYLSQIKDAGVSVTVLNEPADLINVELVVLYDPAVLNAKTSGSAGVDGLVSLTLSDSGGTDVVAKAVNDVVTRLPFNGEYRNSDLLAAVQAVDGIRVADIVRVEASPGNSALFTQVVGYRRPTSGYYALNRLTLRGKPYNEAE